MWNCSVCTYACMLVWVHMCVYGCMHVCYMLQFGELKEVPQCFVLHCFVTFVQWALRPSLMQQTLVCLFWKASICHGTTNLSYWLSYYLATSVLFHGLFVNGWHFIYDTWHRILGITCTLHWCVQSQKTHLFGGKWLCDKNNSITAPTHFQRVATRVVVTQSAAHTLKTSPIMSTSLLGEVIQILACVWLRF